VPTRENANVARSNPLRFIQSNNHGCLLTERRCLDRGDQLDDHLERNLCSRLGVCPRQVDPNAKRATEGGRKFGDVVRGPAGTTEVAEALADLDVVGENG
jgi:hypothetical protein